MQATALIGLDLGQARDPSAMVVIKAAGKDKHRRTMWKCPLLKRWNLGTSYLDIVAEVSKTAGMLDKPALVIDGTGVGRAVMDIFRAGKLPVSELVGVTITGGHEVNQVSADTWNVPKKDLVGAVMSVMQPKRLKVAQVLKHGATLLKELETFRMKVTISANETFEAWRERDHDDLVLAMATALWYGEIEAPQFDIRPINLRHGTVPRSRTELLYEQIRYFRPHDSYQPMPKVGDKDYPGCPDFKTQEEAAWFVERLHVNLGSTPPDVAIELDDKAKAAVVKKLREWMQERRIKPQHRA